MPAAAAGDRRERGKMAILKLDPPPETDDAAELRAYISDLYDELKNIVYNIDGDNLSDELRELLNLGG